jgi:hypothetical protein
MKTSTQKTVIPHGYTGRNFNYWQKHLQKEIDKIKNTNVSAKLR